MVNVDVILNVFLNYNHYDTMNIMKYYNNLNVLLITRIAARLLKRNMKRYPPIRILHKRPQ